MFAATHLGCSIDDIKLTDVSGGYSRNRRSIAEYNGQYVFVKEVDVDLLSDEGEREIAWLRKDYELVIYLSERGFAGISDWAKLSEDGKVLLLPCYRPEDGWVWTFPEDKTQCKEYIDAVVTTTKQLEVMQITDEDIKKYTMEPFLSDEIGGDMSLTKLADDGEMRGRVIEKLSSMLESGEYDVAKQELRNIISLLGDVSRFDELKKAAEDLLVQPNRYIGHCDVRSDNLAYNTRTKQVRLVDWNWASMVPSNFGATEFLVDARKHGIDVSDWEEYLNHELLAASVGFWLSRCLKEPLRPGSSLREMQAVSAAMAYDMYSS